MPTRGDSRALMSVLLPLSVQGRWRRASLPLGSRSAERTADSRLRGRHYRPFSAPCVYIIIYTRSGHKQCHAAAVVSFVVPYETCLPWDIRMASAIGWGGEATRFHQNLLLTIALASTAFTRRPCRTCTCEHCCRYSTAGADCA
jgi:hypothetical protein